MRRVLAGQRLGCEIGAAAGFLTAVFVLGALSTNPNWDHDPAVFATWGLGAYGAGFVTGLLVGISVVIKQGRKASADKAPPRRAAEDGPDSNGHCTRPGGERPTVFASKKGSDLDLQVLKRSK